MAGVEFADLKVKFPAFTGNATLRVLLEAPAGTKAGLGGIVNVKPY